MLAVGGSFSYLTIRLEINFRYVSDRLPPRSSVKDLGAGGGARGRNSKVGMPKTRGHTLGGAGCFGRHPYPSVISDNGRRRDAIG